MSSGSDDKMDRLFGLDEPELELLGSFPPPPPPGMVTNGAQGPEKSPRAAPPPVPPQARRKSGALVVRSGMLGTILVDNGLLTAGQRDECLKLQSIPGSDSPFGEIAVQLGYVSRETLEEVLKAQRAYVKNVRREQSVAIPVPDALLELELQPEEDVEAQRMMAWLGSAMRHGASDLHLMTGKPIVLRRHGRMVVSRDRPLSANDASGYLRSILSEEDLDLLDRDFSVTRCFDLPGGGRARACIFRHLSGMNGVFRLIPSKVPSLTDLNLPEAIGKFTTFAQGLVLISGPISSGKTTTLASLVDIINRERHRHIITVEDPIEFVHENRASLITQRQVGVHTDSFSGALRAALREDPDIIVVGQMHDPETARLAVTAAETGHLVFATLHTQSAIHSINRVLDIFPPGEQAQVRAILAESLKGVVAQQLVPRADVQGRVPVTELMFANPAVRNLIREDKIHQVHSALRVSKESGNLTMEEHAQLLLDRGLISQKTRDGLSTS